MTGFQRSVAVWALVGAVLSATLICGPAASADPEDAVAAAPAEPPITWTQLGRPDRLGLLGSDLPIDTGIPVPDGMTPGVLTGLIGSAANVVGGRVDILDDRGLFLASIPVPADLTSAPFDVDINAARIAGGVAALTFVLRVQNPPGDSCTRPPSVTLSQLGSRYLGQTPFPAVVADFMPGYVDQIILRIGPAPTPAQQQAALDLVAKLTRRYRQLPVRFDIDMSPDPVAPGPPTRRVIELVEGPAGMSVRNPGSPDAALVVSGRGVELGRQVQLFSDTRIQLAQAGSAAVTAATEDELRGTTVKSFAQLGINGDISVLGSATLYIGFDAGLFALGPLQEATFRLLGHYTPGVGGEASVVVRAGNSVLASRRLDESGLVDLTGTIPPEAISSNIGIAVQLRYVPSQRCAPLNDRMQFTVDPESVITVTAGSHNRGGFPVLPMAFTPEFNVAVDRPEHLRFAARAINLLGQQTAVVLQPHLTSLAEASGSGLGLLVVAAGERLAAAGLEPPVLPGRAGTADIGGVPAIDVDLNGPIGVVQAFSRRGAMVLAVDAGTDWGLTDLCFDYIDSLPSRWASLNGDVVATGAAGRSVNLTVREGGALIDNYPGDVWKWWTWVTVASVSAAAAGAGFVFWRRHISRRID